MNLQSNLGALELNGAILQSDSALEQAASAGPTTFGGCPTLACRHIDDAVLETAAGHMAIGPTPGLPNHPWCQHIEDAALEHSAVQHLGPSAAAPVLCRHHVEDGVVEQAISAGPGGGLPHTASIYCYGHIEDGELEGTARERLMGPTRYYINGQCR